MKLSSEPDGSPTAKQCSEWVVAKRTTLFIFLLLASIVTLYWPTLTYTIHELDDAVQLIYVRNFSSVADCFGRDFGNLYRPVKNLYFFLFDQWFPENYVVWRAGVLAMVSTFAILLVHFCRSIFPTSKWALVAVAVYFATPANASAISWLSTVHMIVCAIALLGLNASGARFLSDEGRGRIVYLLLFLLSLYLALGSYENAVIAPGLLFLYCVLIKKEPIFRRELILLLLIASIIVLEYLFIRGLFQSEFHQKTNSVPSVERITLIFSAPRYLWIHTLRWLYPFGQFGFLIPDDPRGREVLNLISWIGLLVLLSVLFRGRLRQPRLVFGVSWFLLCMFPLCNFLGLGNGPIHDHYLFLSGIGLAIAVSECLRLGFRIWNLQSRARIRIAVTAGLVLGLFFYLRETVQRVDAWASFDTLCAETLHNYPEHPECIAWKAREDWVAGKFADTLPAIERARSKYPWNEVLLSALMYYHLGVGQNEVVLRLIREKYGNSAPPAVLLVEGNALYNLGRYEEAIKVYFKVMEYPLRISLYLHAGENIASIFAETGRIDIALNLIDILLRLDSKNPRLIETRDTYRGFKGNPDAVP